MTQPVPAPIFRGFDNFGAPLAGGFLFTYANNTTTPQATYTDSTGSVPNTNPVVLNARGEAPVWLTTGQTYTITLTDKFGVVIPGWPVNGMQGADFAADALKTSLSASTGSTLIGTRQTGGGSTTRTLQDKLSDFVSAFDFMSPAQIADVRANTGSIDVSAALQAAISTGRNVHLPAGIYATTTLIRAKAVGQVVSGEGSGDKSVGARTRIKYIGAAGGKIFSFADGNGTMMQNCRLEDIYLDGNALANMGVEAYDDTISGGAWRNVLRNVAIFGCTFNITTPAAVPSRCVYVGDGSAPNFGHDIDLQHCYLNGSAIGIEGAGAIYSLHGKCTIESMTTAGIKGNSGSAWNLGDTVFSKNAWDVIQNNAQVISASGAWFEDSTSGIVQASTGHITVLTGCHLSTLSTTCLMDLGNAAGSIAVRNCYVSGSMNQIININGTSEQDFTGSGVLPQNGYRIRSQGINRSDQAACAAGLLNDITNATGDGTLVTLDSFPWVAEYNLFTYFDTATGKYIAGVFGELEIEAQIGLGNLGAAHTDAQLFINVAGQAYLIARTNAAATKTPSNEVLLVGTGRSVMINPGQYVALSVMVSGSTKTVTIQSGGALTNWRTRLEARYI